MNSTLLILLVTLVLLLAWMGYNYWRLKRAATLIENKEFAEKMYGAQVIDLRTPAEFSKKHILGARNIPSEQIKQSLGAIRKDKPVLIYENDRGQRVTSTALLLKKAGYNEIYILSYGLNEWDGKVKKNY